ncbi:hypothetical protein FHG87_001457 [Trinorchestia longiramus]|nr:hypothetical protein FHG87_001457 [Trinorchestia longiramus]
MADRYCTKTQLCGLCGNFASMSRWSERGRHSFLVKLDVPFHSLRLDPFDGSLEPFDGSPEPFDGSPEPFDGSPEPFDGSPEPFDGIPEPFDGILELQGVTLNSISGLSDILKIKHQYQIVYDRFLQKRPLQWLNELLCVYNTSLYIGRTHRVGVSNSSVVESEGRVWVEVGGNSGNGKQTDGLKLRVTHLHPENPVIVPALLKYRLEHQDQESGLLADNMSTKSEEDFWFNHWQGPDISQPETTAQPNTLRASFRCNTCNKKVATMDSVLSGTAEASQESPVLAHLPSIRRSQIKINAANANLSPPRASQQTSFLLGSSPQTDHSDPQHLSSGRSGGLRGAVEARVRGR